MVCVKTITYSILVNGEPKGLIHPSRGLRQRDPLSPFLFLLCTEGLHGLIKKAASNGDINGFRLCKQGPKLTHLIFADDNLRFYRANSTKCSKVMDLLSLYEDVSSQKINRDKTTFFFNKLVTEANRQIIKGILGVHEIQHYEKYLGLPSLTGNGKRASFNYIKERVWRKLQRWEGKLLSQAGREVLIKAVIQAIPTYAMGCFKLPMESGKYSCKSGYRFLKMEEEEEGSEVAQNGDKVFWHSIWGLQVPNKIKNFLWRACREAIPTKANLERRHITENPLWEGVVVPRVPRTVGLYEINEGLVLKEDPKIENIVEDPIEIKYKNVSIIHNHQASIELLKMTTRYVDFPGVENFNFVINPLLIDVANKLKVSEEDRILSVAHDTNGIIRGEL
ncbi:hypothetical protein SO802_006998 [Lithocarpus litseifolius]|uniref:Reverse transcriptase zinc-binding domain-containing protein n=1 Tax=Lithocarpus litseifolius TaxID=425828 RepID=A0AAW2DRN5_9ROSI